MQTYHIELSCCERGQGPFWLIVDTSAESAIAWLAKDNDRPVTDYVCHSTN